MRYLFTLAADRRPSQGKDIEHLDELRDLDAGELVRVGARLDVVRVCRVRQLDHAKRKLSASSR